MAFDIQKTSIEITAVDKTKVAFDSVKSSIGNLTSQFGALTGLLGAGAFVAFTKRIIDQADSMNDLSKRTGIAVEQIGAWRLATEQSGTSMEALTNALGKGSKYLVQHGEDLKKIGINAKTSEELILQLSGIISQMPSDDPRRTALAMQVLGKSAGELIPLLSEGEQGLRKMLDRGRELNPVTKEMAENADKFNDNLAEMKLLSGGLFVDLVGKILPSLNTYLKQLQTVVSEGDWMDKLLFFTVGYVPGKIADKTDDPVERIKAYTQGIADLQKQLKNSQLTGLPDQDYLKNKIAEAQAGLDAQRARLPFRVPKHSSNPTNYDATNLDAFLKPDSNGTPKKDAIAERIKALGIENTLLAQGVPLEDARTIARLKGDGATDQQIVKMLNATSVQNQYEAAEKSAEKTKQDLIKATQDHAEAMKQMLESADEAVLSAQREYQESERNLQVMQLGESAVIRMEVARLQEAAATAEQGLSYARLNGLSQENIDFTETQILRLKQLAEARLNLADSSDATQAFEKEKERIKDLEKEQKDAAKRVADEQKRLSDSMSQSLTDALLRGFENGKDFAENFRETLKNMFKSLVLQPAIKFLIDGSGINQVLGSLGSVFSGSGAGQAAVNDTGSSSIFGKLSSIGDIFSSGNASIVSGIESLGAFLSTGNGGLGDLLGGALGQYAGEISNALPYAGALLQAFQGNITGAAFTAIGTAIGGPIGGAIGGIVGSLFGSKKLPPRSYSAQRASFENGVLSQSSAPNLKGSWVSAGANQGLQGLNEAFIKSLASIFDEFGVGGRLDVFSAVSKKKSADGGLGVTLDGVGLSHSYTGKLKKGSIQQAFDTLVEKAMGEGLATAIKNSPLSDGVKKFFDGLVKKEDVADAINTLVGLNKALVDLPPVFDAIRNAIDTTTYGTSIADLKTRFAAVGTYTSLFYTEQEKFATFSKQLTTQFDAMNVIVPKSRDEYRKLVDGIVVTDESTSNLFNGLVALAPAMDAFFKQIEQLQGTVERDSFVSRLDAQRYEGVAANYGSAFAADYTSNLNAGRIRVGTNGTANSAAGNDLVSQIKLLRTAIEAGVVYASKQLDVLRKYDKVGLNVTVLNP